MPLPKVRGIAEEEMFKVVKTGKKYVFSGNQILPLTYIFSGPPRRDGNEVCNIRSNHVPLPAEIMSFKLIFYFKSARF